MLSLELLVFLAVRHSLSPAAIKGLALSSSPTVPSKEDVIDTATILGRGISLSVRSGKPGIARSASLTGNGQRPGMHQKSTNHGTSPA
jgi:hypothetical protein